MRINKDLDIYDSERILYPAYIAGSKIFCKYLNSRLRESVVSKYPEKLPGSIWAITTFFNPAKYKNKYENYKIFRENSKRQGLMLLTVELRFDNEPYEIEEDDADILIRIQGQEKNILWQKEPLMNIALKELPPDCDKVIWIDCDLIFHNDNWVNETANLLEEYNVVQPFSASVRLTNSIKSSVHIKNIGYGVNDSQLIHSLARGALSYKDDLSVIHYQLNGHVGFAWAARKSIFDEIGFFDSMISGANDSIMAYAFYGKDWYSNESLLPALTEEIIEWRKKAYQRIQGSVFFCNGIVDHLWHGDKEDRGYKNRENIFLKYKFDPKTDIKRNKNGLLEWSTTKNEFKEAIANYFCLRREDCLKLKSQAIEKSEKSLFRVEANTSKLASEDEPARGTPPNWSLRSKILGEASFGNSDTKSLYPAFYKDRAIFSGIINSHLNKSAIPKFPKKLPGSIWAITTFFNPIKYKNKYENYKIFREHSKNQGLKLVTVELCFDDNPYEIQEDDTDILVRLKGSEANILWQKESLLNIALKNLPDDCDKVIWIDCDLVFHNDNWVSETAKLLGEYNVIQPFTSAVRLPEACNSSKLLDKLGYGCFENQILHGVARGVANLGLDVLNRAYADFGHVGFVWAIRRNIIEEFGFIEALICGGNDSIMTNAFYGLDWILRRSYFSKKLRDKCISWRKQVYNKVQGSVYFCPGIVDHLWHGNIPNRDYIDREKRFANYDYDPDVDIKKSSNGLLEWSSTKQDLIKNVKDYFYARKEDLNDISLVDTLLEDMQEIDSIKADKILYPAYIADEKMFKRYLRSRVGIYTVPKFPQNLPGSIWAITTFFNPAKYTNKYENYKIFREKSKQQGLNLLTVELRFDDDPYEIAETDADILIKIQGDEKNILWQKESLLNIALEQLPVDCDKVIWIDCDLIFHNNNWVRETAALLEEYNVVQPFSSILRLPKEQNNADSLTDIKFDYRDKGIFHSAARGAAVFGNKVLGDSCYDNRGAVGYAWSIRRSILEDFKFFDSMILGGADSVIAFALYGEHWPASEWYLSAKLKEKVKEWSEKVHSKVKGSVYYTNGLINHLWHGNQEDRNYNERYDLITSNNFDPDLDLKSTESGLLEWSTNKKSLVDGTKNYFYIRQEQ